MSMAVLRRLLLGVSVMEPDKMHFHHRLNKWFKSQRLVVAILTVAQIAFAFAGIAIYMLKIYIAGWIGLGVLAVICVVYTLIRVKQIRKRIAADT